MDLKSVVEEALRYYLNDNTGKFDDGEFIDMRYLKPSGVRDRIVKAIAGSGLVGSPPPTKVFTSRQKELIKQLTGDYIMDSGITLCNAVEDEDPESLEQSIVELNAAAAVYLYCLQNTDDEGTECNCSGGCNCGK
ncbi:hypothetical protein SAMN05446037_1006125 [Anaerovirgula multivorans]|uniref:Uncharacterized protein n=1 Tax=Anaerovirgula multivorans TaxID=312168 RepID=A0A239CTK1_9FIRM|nr:hypothetical protein [Anaerovirgula multivorans]SNS22981.1 hypothetical protein SAMN05446037_1006125 [Anaerovirgula multivorans]